MKIPSIKEKYINYFVSILLLAFFILVSANLIKYSSAIKLTIVQNKDLIDILTKIIGTLALIIGAIASYYRFFRGRTFAARAELNLEVKVYDTEKSFKLHVINLEISNVGPVPIWEPQPKIEVFLYGPSGTESYVISKWWQPEIDNQAVTATVAVIDTQECSQFHSTQHIPLEIWAVLYVASVKSDRGYTWMRAVTVSNKVGSG